MSRTTLKEILVAGENGSLLLRLRGKTPPQKNMQYILLVGGGTEMLSLLMSGDEVSVPTLDIGLPFLTDLLCYFSYIIYS